MKRHKAWLSLKIKIIISIAISSLSFVSAQSQDVKIIESTKQSWSGGICCRYGTNYYLLIETTNDKVIPDTVWIGGRYFKLLIGAKGTFSNCTKEFDSLHKVNTYSINVGVIYDESTDRYSFPGEKNNREKDKKVSVPEFKGAALITYSFKGKRGSYIVEEMKELGPLNYP